MENNGVVSQILKGDKNISLLENQGVSNDLQKELETLKNIYISENFNFNSKVIYYIRTSVKRDLTKPEEWQLHDNQSLENTIISENNSAFSKEKSYYIYTIIKYLFEKRNSKELVIYVKHFSRFSRCIKTVSCIHSYLLMNDYNLIIESVNTRYDFIKDYKQILIDINIHYNSSKEKSVISTEYHRKKRLRLDYTNLATNYFKSFISQNKFKNLSKLGRKNLSQARLDEYKRNTSIYKDTENLYYFYCNVTNLNIVCPRDIACLENVNHTIINGFNKDDFLAIANSQDEKLSWICYHYRNLDVSSVIDVLE